MNNPDFVTVEVGDLVADTIQPDRGLSVVTEVRPEIQTVPILDFDKNRSLRMGYMPGTTREPLDVVGSMPLGEIVLGMMRGAELKAISPEQYEEALCSLQAAKALGPVRRPRLPNEEFTAHPGKQPPLRNVLISIIPKPSEDMAASREAAFLIEREVWGKSSPTEDNIDRAVGSMENRTTVGIRSTSGRLLAAGALQPTRDNPTTECFITDVATDRNYRGRGLGKTVMAMLEKLAREKKINKLLLTAIDEEAAGFYEHLKYVKEGGHYVKPLKD